MKLTNANTGKTICVPSNRTLNRLVRELIAKLETHSDVGCVLDGCDCEGNEDNKTLVDRIRKELNK